MKYHFLARTDCIIFSLPKRVIFWHISLQSSAGILFRYVLKFCEMTPNPPTTIGITSHSQSHIFPNSTRRAPYFDIFSFSLASTSTSEGQLMSIMNVFWFSLSLITMSGLLAQTAWSVLMIIYQSISILYP